LRFIIGSTSTIKPSSGHYKLNADLNKGAAFNSRDVKKLPVKEVGILSGNSSTIEPPSPWIKIAKDLNEGAGGDMTVLT
jgi:hypothetical protein